MTCACCGRECAIDGVQILYNGNDADPMWSGGPYTAPSQAAPRSKWFNAAKDEDYCSAWCGLVASGEFDDDGGL